MKEFIKTLVGKTILFVLCIAFICTLIVSIAGIAFYTQSELGFYTASEQAVIKAGQKLDIPIDLLHIAYALRYGIYGIAMAALIASIASFVALMHASGRRPYTDDLQPGPLHKIPYDLMLGFCGFFGVILIYAVGSNAYGIPGIMCTCGVLLLEITVCLGLCMSAASRIKRHTLVKSSFIYIVLWQICKILKRLHSFNLALFQGMPLIWKTLIIVGGISIIEFIAIVALGWQVGVLLILWFLEKLILIPAILYLALTLRKLQKGGKALAEGDLSYQTDTKGMLWDFKEHGENLNSIAGGMSIAVGERMKSERMKTELITNVSHDIKTPLTSIINYATLIGNENCDNQKVTEYSEVLVRQSEKLKRLIEDLVEASKASSGNLEVLLSPCDAAVFITQASGEYEEKLQNAELSLITKQPENELRIMADGRRMWRIFDNLMNNICNYSQPGTRVYLSFEQQDSNAVITFKNTSREALDMTEEELMERFTRGDASRNTEGNGLGLSIARSMAELQGGDLKLDIDGDLFKAILTFPLIES